MSPNLSSSLAALARRLAVDRTVLAQAFLSGQLTPLRYLRRHTRLIDQLLLDLTRLLPLPTHGALLAVGGYGRRELFPASDIDLTLLVPAPLSPAEAARAEALVATLWDIGLEVGISVRTPEEALALARGDITVATNLLEGRRIAGAVSLAEQLLAQLIATLDPIAFFRAKLLEQERRHHRWLSPYVLEPNVKEHPGGWRDLNILIWIARILGYTGRWSALAKAGLLYPHEARELDRCQRFLAAIRIHLHLLAGRHEDRLLFDHQIALAERLAIPPDGERRPAEVLMHRYYTTAKTTLHLSRLLIAAFEEHLEQKHALSAAVEPHPIDPHFLRRNDRLDVVHDRIFLDHPETRFTVVLRLMQHPEIVGLTPRAARLLWAARETIDAHTHCNPLYQNLFLAIFREPRGIVHATRFMNQFDLLARYLPAWGQIVGQMQYDLYHEFTVDLHTLMVIRNLRRFTMEEHAHEYPEMNALMAQFARPWILYLAALFHDIGKGRGGDHSQIGAQLARDFLGSHPITPADLDLIAWLVREHLTMSRIAQKEDLSDPATIDRFARHVGTEERLIALYLLTHADIRGTSPRVWTPWKERLLAELFYQTRNHLRRWLAGHPLPDPIAERCERARAILRFHGLTPGVERSLWNRLGPDYFLRHTPELIAWHTRHLYRRHTRGESIVRARALPDGHSAEVMIFTPDRPQLLVTIVRLFVELDWNIWEARIFTTPDGWALDTFVVALPPDQAVREALSLVEYQLTRALQTPYPPPPLQPRSRRLSPLARVFGFPPQITIAPDEHATRHLLTIVAVDRPGALFDIVSTLAAHHIDVHLARIHTVGERLEDTFVVVAPHLHRPDVQNALTRELLARLTLPPRTLPS
ncbi:MAG: [protein-PII] uridylyltransferase [Hydrogenophilus sp.]|nr:[protein-PII] uridylyltransferase [Hydrogenophilus sp.]